MERAWVRYGVACLAALIVGIAIGSSLTKAVSDQEIARLEQQVFELESQVMAWEEWYKDWEELQRTLAESSQSKMESWGEINGVESELRKIRKELELANFQRRMENIMNLGK